jgi:hypothetical protein
MSYFYFLIENLETLSWNSVDFRNIAIATAIVYFSLGPD